MVADALGVDPGALTGARPAATIEPSTLPGYQPSAGFVLLPLLGRVTAGPGGSAEEAVLGYHHVEKTWIPPGQEDGCFLLDVRGDSMVDAGIRDGDRILVCRTVSLRDGDVAVVDVDGEAMVKRVYSRDGSFLLVSENPQFKPVEVPRARIIGRVMTSWRYH
jgi:repressor LexA